MSTSLKLDKVAEDLEYELKEDINLNTHGTKSYFHHLKLIDKLPFSKVEVYYSDSIWDFSSIRKLNISGSSMRLNFERAPNAFLDDIKNFILLKILDNRHKLQGIHRSCQLIINFFNYVADEKKYYYFKHIPDKVVKDYLKSLEEKANEDGSNMDEILFRSKATIEDFYTFYAANFEDLFTTELKDILNRKKHIEALKREREKNKVPDIPKDYFDKLLSALIKVIDDEEAPLDFRSLACLFLIMSQIGLRWGEMLGLETGQDKTTKLKTGETAYYLEYKTWKREKGNNTYTIAKTYMNELAKKGYDTLAELHKEKRESIETAFSYLYMGDANQNDISHFPLSPESTTISRHRFYVYLDRYLSTIDVPKEQYNEGFAYIDTSRYWKLRPYRIKTLTYPDTKQYRVHVCTELYEKQVSLKFIKKLMSHLSTEMEGYYVRAKTPSIQEDEIYAEKVFDRIVSGLKPIGRAGLKGEIDSFIAKGKYNIEKDRVSIVAMLKAEMPVRPKTGGFCCKSMQGFPCMSGDETDDFYCAYGVCPNIFSFFYNIDVDYRKLKELEFAIEDNKRRGHKAMLTKNYNSLSKVIHEKILPELEDLEAQIAKHGLEAIVEEYSEDCPDLRDIIENVDTIYVEVEKWKTELRIAGIKIPENVN
jgi:integrase